MLRNGLQCLLRWTTRVFTPCDSLVRPLCSAGTLLTSRAPIDADASLPRSLRHQQVPTRTRIIHDVHEEEAMALDGIAPEEEPPLWDPVTAWSSERGVAGVFDVEELVSVLREEGAADVSVVRIPAEHAYVQHMVFATTRSRQHMLQLAQFVRRLYKRKRLPSDPVPRIEGRDTAEWVAMDLVNIALHLMDAEMRTRYDVDGLWAVGPEFDELSQPEQEVQLLTTDPLADFQPWPAEPRTHQT